LAQASGIAPWIRNAVIETRASANGFRQNQAARQSLQHGDGHEQDDENLGEMRGRSIRAL
jgi:hypothetical protein